MTMTIEQLTLEGASVRVAPLPPPPRRIWCFVWDEWYNNWAYVCWYGPYADADIATQEMHHFQDRRADSRWGMVWPSVVEYNVIERDGRVVGYAPTHTQQEYCLLARR